MKKSIITTLIVAFTLVCIISCSTSNYVKVRQYIVAGEPATPQDARNFDVFIIATGDVGGDVNQESETDDALNISTFAGFVQATRRFNENTLVVDTGNFLYGTRFASGNTTTDYKNGASMIDLARKIGYNAMNIGRNDFLYGRGPLSDNISNARKTPKDEKEKEVFYVSQNVKRGGNFTDKFKIFNFNGFKLGIIGLATPDTAMEVKKDISGGFSFNIDYNELQRDINSLNRVVDYVVLLSDLRSGDEVIPRFVNIETVIANIKGVDLVINGDGDSRTVVPKKVKDKTEKEVTLVMPGPSLENVGLIQFQIEAGIPVGDPVFTLISAREIRNPAASNILTQLNIVRRPENEDLTDYVNSLDDKVNVSEGTPVAYLPYEFQADRNQLGSIQTDIGYIIADAFKIATDSDIAIFPSNIVKKSLKSGELSRKEIFRCLPCFDSVIRVSMTGQEIYDAVEYGFGLLPFSTGRYPQTNLIIEYNATADAGNRVVSVSLQNGIKIERNQQAYTVATVDSVLNGVYDYNRYFKDRNKYIVPNPVGKGNRPAWEIFSDYLARTYPINRNV